MTSKPKLSKSVGYHFLFHLLLRKSSSQLIHRKIPAAGFTLPELLVATIIAALVVGITAQVMIGQLLEGRRLEAAQRVRENLGRLNYLIQIEASEAEEIVSGRQANDECDGGGTGGFTLFIPKPDGAYASQDNRTGIEYYNNGNDIWRCGPRVFRNGVLDHAVSSDGGLHANGVVVRNAQINLDSCDNTSNREVSYRVNFAGGNFGLDPNQCNTAHARTIFVCNQPVGSGGSLGDCEP